MKTTHFTSVDFNYYTLGVLQNWFHMPFSNKEFNFYINYLDTKFRYTEVCSVCSVFPPPLPLSSSIISILQACISLYLSSPPFMKSAYVLRGILLSQDSNLHKVHAIIGWREANYFPGSITLFPPSFIIY